MTSINAGIPRTLAEGVREAQTRGQESEPVREETRVQERDFAADDTVSRKPAAAPAPVRRRRGVARLRSAAASRRSEGSPTGAVGMRRQIHAQPVAGPSSRPFVTQGSSSSNSDPFGISIREDPPLGTPQIDPSSDDESITSADQENDSALSPTKPRETPRKLPSTTPRRPHGAPPVPLGELSLEDPSASEAEVAEEDDTIPSSPSSTSEDQDQEEEEEDEYPPSPRKSPSKTPFKKPQHTLPHPTSNPFFQASPSQALPKPHRTAALFGPGARNFTPPNALVRPLASDSPYIAYSEAGDDTTMAEPSPSPRKIRSGPLFQTPAKKSDVPAARTLFGRPVAAAGTPNVNFTGNGKGVKKSPPSPSSAEMRRLRDKRLWELCGGDVKKWNRGEFEGEGFAMKAARW